MKALIQRVMNAKVTVHDELVSCIDRGICVFIGISKTDGIKDMEYIAQKILNVKLYDDEQQKKWKKSVMDNQLEVLCVSQFTLYNTWKGNKPDFHNAMSSDKSKEFYEQFLSLLKKKYTPDKIKDGRFGEYMQVCLQNDGPVTLEIESPAHLVPNKVPCKGDADSKPSRQDSKPSRQDSQLEDSLS